MNWLYTLSTILEPLVDIIFAVALPFALKWMKEWAGNNKMKQHVVRTAEVAATVLHEVLEEMGPAFQAAAADGKVTSVEKAALKAKAIQALRDELEDKHLDYLQHVLGTRKLDHLLGAHIERALAARP